MSERLRHPTGRQGSFSLIRALTLALVHVLVWAAHGESVSDQPATSKSLPSQIERGRMIYLHGKTPDGPPIMAVLGGQTHALPAAYLPCASCHGADGRGRPEGGALPSDVTWKALTRPYEVEAASGRSHPPYDRRLFIRAVTMGVDPAGNELGIAMPRYRFTKADVEALASYVERLGQDGEPGVSDGVLRIGTLLPLEGKQAAAGRAVEAALRALFDRAWSTGGIYGRRLELVVVRAGSERAKRRRAIEALLDTERVLAVVAPFSAGADEDLVELAAALDVPVVGPLTQTTVPSATVPAPVFYLLSGIEEQVRVLWDFAAGRHAGNPMSMRAAAIVPENPPVGMVPDAWLTALRQQATTWGMDPPTTITYRRGPIDPVVAIEPSGEGAWTSLFLLGPGDDALDLAAALSASGSDGPEQRREPRLELYLPGPLAGSLLDQASDAVVLAFPSLPSDGAPEARQDWRSFATEHSLPAEHAALQHLAAVAAEILFEALRASGRDVTRQAITRHLENLYRHETGWTRPLTFTANRRIGAFGGYVVKLDPERGFVPLSGWIEPRE